jgi:hypothetical protein
MDAPTQRRQKDHPDLSDDYWQDRYQKQKKLPQLHDAIQEATYKKVLREAAARARSHMFYGVLGLLLAIGRGGQADLPRQYHDLLRHEERSDIRSIYLEVLPTLDEPAAAKMLGVDHECGTDGQLVLTERGRSQCATSYKFKGLAGIKTRDAFYSDMAESKRNKERPDGDPTKSPPTGCNRDKIGLRDYDNYELQGRFLRLIAPDVKGGNYIDCPHCHWCVQGMPGQIKCHNLLCDHAIDGSTLGVISCQQTHTQYRAHNHETALLTEDNLRLAEVTIFTRIQQAYKFAALL